MNVREFWNFRNAASALVRALPTLVDNEMLKKEISAAEIQVKHTLKLLAFATRDLNDRRKDAIRNSINPMYLSLLSYDKSPSFVWLLGDDIDSEMDDLDKVKKQSERLVKQNQGRPPPNSNTNFRRRGRPNTDSSSERDNRPNNNAERKD